MDFGEIAKDIKLRLSTDSDAKAVLVSSIIFVVMAVIVILNSTGVFILGPSMNRVMLICAVLNFFMVLDLTLIKKDFKRDLYIILCCIYTGILYAGLSYHVVIMLIYPACCAALYTERKYYWESVIFGTISIFLGHYIAVDWTCVFDDPLTSRFACVVYGFIPRILELIVIWSIIGYIHKRQNETVKELVNKSDEIYKDQEYLVYTLAKVTSNFSDETGLHISRVSDYAEVMLKHLKYPSYYTWQCKLAAMLHDFGKILVPKDILEKPGKLTPQEFEIIKTHAVNGRNLLSNTPSPVLNLAAKIAYEHHECFDGTGYYSLKENEIDDVSQIVSIVDIFDALTTERCYKKAWSFEESVDFIKSNRGKKFKPELVDLFEDSIDEIREIFNRR